MQASNRPWDIDEAIQRRLSRSFKVGLPSFNQRVQILRVILEPDPAADVSTADVLEIAKRTEKYSGSDLQELCRAAAFGPVRAAVDEMVSRQEAANQKEQAAARSEKNGAAGGAAVVESPASLRKLVLTDFLAVIGDGDALTKEASKEYQAELAKNRRKAASARSNTYKPPGSQPDIIRRHEKQAGEGVADAVIDEHDATTEEEEEEDDVEELGELGEEGDGVLPEAMAGLLRELSNGGGGGGFGGEGGGMEALAAAAAAAMPGGGGGGAAGVVNHFHIHLPGAGGSGEGSGQSEPDVE